MTWPPETDAERRAVHRRQLAGAAALAVIESFAPSPPPKPPLDPAAWARLLELKREALASIENFKPWWL